MQLGLARSLLLVTGLSILVAPSAEATVNHRFGLGVDVWGRQEGGVAIEPAVDLLWEGDWPVGPAGIPRLGLGAELLLPRATDRYWDLNRYAYLALYGVGRWHFTARSRGSIVARLGVAAHRVSGDFRSVRPFGDHAFTATAGVGCGLRLSSSWSAELAYGHIVGDHPGGRGSRQLKSYDRIAIQLWFTP